MTGKCASCGRRRPICARSLCRSCYNSWYKHSRRPEDAPPAIRFSAAMALAHAQGGCLACGDDQAPPRARGWCRKCYDAWRRAGKPESGPPPRTGGRYALAERLEDLQFLLDSGVSAVSELAARMDVKQGTVRAYLWRLHRGDAEPPATRADASAEADRVMALLYGQEP